MRRRSSTSCASKEASVLCMPPGKLPDGGAGDKRERGPERVGYARQSLADGWNPLPCPPEVTSHCPEVIPDTRISLPTVRISLPDRPEVTANRPEVSSRLPEVTSGRREV